MEIKELVSYYLNNTNQTLDVSFRLFEDSDDELRNAQIGIDEIKKYGYSFLDDNNEILKDMFGYDDYEDDQFDDFDDELFEESIDENEIISFLNEYYIVNPKNLPESEIF